MCLARDLFARAAELPGCMWDATDIWTWRHLYADNVVDDEHTHAEKSANMYA